ncbi:Membrane steroid-binding protein 2 [Vanrija pseudolonga]|uniref:Membrane steroid-binding protein 2 n=1 Tax=Vanrija pseudolonga TaxID=143232 RepID=A0AAF1BJ68_9TREE|nr:Membrane steroid-binding protein 2 [Vanrija pseudolonga]
MSETDRKPTTKKSAPKEPASSSGSILPRLLVLAIFLPLLSHFLTGNYTFSLGPVVRPYIKAVRTHPLNPLAAPQREFTLLELARHDGADPNKPIYISIKGQVFDVSANPRVYGKGGAYNMMAGRDASRSFVTGCFQTHLTHDLRGFTDQDMASLDHWVKFFTDSDKYHKVGTAILPPIHPDTPIPAGCHDAQEKAEERHGQRPQNKPAGHGAGKKNPHGGR